MSPSLFITHSQTKIILPSSTGCLRSHAIHFFELTEMKSMKGRFLKKLNFIPSIGTLKQGLVSHLNSTEKFSYQNLHIPPIYVQEGHKKESLAGHFGVSNHKTESKDEELGLELDFFDKVNVTPSVVSNDRVPAMDYPEAPVSTEITAEQDLENEAEAEIEEHPSLLDFEERCIPGGSQSVILYTTSLRSIRKTFEDCHAIRFLLESFKVMFYERDVSLHLEFREELWRILDGKVIPPKLFINGRYIGGADEVIGLHEQGKLKKLLAGIPLNLSSSPCTGCGNMRFVVCSNCNGSCKVFVDDQDDEKCIRCPECNENGLAKCPICS